MKFLAAIIDRILDRFAPLPDDRAYWIAVAEASRDSWESGELQCPECFPEGWEDQLHDACAFCDDEDLPTDANPPLVSVGTLLDLIAQTLRDNDVRPYLLPAQMVAQAIHLNYRLTPR